MMTTKNYNLPFPTPLHCRKAHLRGTAAFTRGLCEPPVLAALKRAVKRVVRTWRDPVSINQSIRATL